MAYFFHLTLWILKSRNEHHMRILFSVAQQSGNFLYKRVLQLQVINHESNEYINLQKSNDCIVLKPKLTQGLFASRELSQHYEDPRKRNNLCIFFYQPFLFCTHFWRTSRPYFSARFSPCSFFVPSTLLHHRDCRKGGARYISLARFCLVRWHVDRATTLRREWQEFSRLDRLRRTQSQ